MLCLLGFAATDFVITITLSAADATAHIVDNPLVPAAFDHPVALTLVLLALLSAVFLKGFKEAIGLAVLIVAVYLALNAVVIGWRLSASSSIRSTSRAGRTRCSLQHGSPLMMLAVAMLLFPKLALGLSGFETGVAVMPLVKGDARRHRGASGRPHRQHQEAAADGGADHERPADGQLVRDDAADSAGGVSRLAARRPAARSPTSRTSISATSSAPSTT